MNDVELRDQVFVRLVQKMDLTAYKKNPDVLNEYIDFWWEVATKTVNRVRPDADLKS